MILKFERAGTKVIATDKAGKVVMEDKLNSNYGRYFGLDNVFFAKCEKNKGTILIVSKSKDTF